MDRKLFILGVSAAVCVILLAGLLIAEKERMAMEKPTRSVVLTPQVMALIEERMNATTTLRSLNHDEQGMVKNRMNATTSIRALNPQEQAMVEERMNASTP